MCVTSEVPGNATYRGSEQRDKINKQLLQTEGEGGYQYFQGQNKNVTHVSRLQCVQAAVAAQIEKVAKMPQRMRNLILSVQLAVEAPDDAGGADHLLGRGEAAG